MISLFECFFFIVCSMIVIKTSVLFHLPYGKFLFNIEHLILKSTFLNTSFKTLELFFSQKEISSFIHSSMILTSVRPDSSPLASGETIMISNLLFLSSSSLMALASSTAGNISNRSSCNNTSSVI